MKVAPFGHCHVETDTKWSFYPHDGSYVLLLTEPSGQVACKATVCLEGWAPPEGHIWLKVWAENRGIGEALESAGVVVLKGSLPVVGAATPLHARLAELTEAAKAEILATFPVGSVDALARAAAVRGEMR